MGRREYLIYYNWIEGGFWQGDKKSGTEGVLFIFWSSIVQVFQNNGRKPNKPGKIQAQIEYLGLSWDQILKLKGNC